VKIVQLTKELAEAKIAELLEIEKTITDQRWTADNFLMDLASKWEYSLAALDEDRVIAFSVCSLKGANLHIHRTVALPEYRGKGLGEDMMDIVTAKCSAGGIRSITLKVHESNMGAQRFHERLGFRRVATEGSRYIYRKGL
jgi:ribosomal protein S18 acetylase RimI-like enzyme